ncbi:MAG TPA: lipid-binding SYLF domain-containing protein [Bryobacteraceae bacterium]
MKAKTFLFTLLFGAATVAPALAADDARERADKRIRDSASVLQEIIGVGGDKGIPRDLIEKAQCIGVIPNLKRAGFIVGAKYGKGVVTCRLAAGGWSAPEIVQVEGGNIGLQIGAGETDFVFAVMNRRGMDRLMSDKFTVGGDAAVMAGPVGRETTAQTDAVAKAEIISWSRAHGVFAGVTLDGATLAPDKDDNHALYGPDAGAHEILMGTARPTAAAQPLFENLRAFPPRG